MVELLASALTGTRASVDVPPLKTPDGPPHDLGQFYVVVDPGAYSADGFYDRLAALAEAIAGQPGARLPGADSSSVDRVDLEGEVWDAALELAGG